METRDTEGITVTFWGRTPCGCPPVGPGLFAGGRNPHIPFSACRSECAFLAGMAVDTIRADRLRQLLALEIARIVSDFEIRRDFLKFVWSAHRDRRPFLDTVFSRWTTVGFPDLALLETDEVAVVDTFFSEVEDFRLYISYTNDMPESLVDHYDWMAKRLRLYGEAAIDRLGGEPERPQLAMPDAESGALLEFPTPLGEVGDDAVSEE
jgi:hypothetical protein